MHESRLGPLRVLTDEGERIGTSDQYRSTDAKIVLFHFRDDGRTGRADHFELLRQRVKGDGPPKEVDDESEDGAWSEDEGDDS